MPAVKAIVAALVSNADVTAELATYDFGSGAAPAIFAVDPAPEDAAGTLVVVSQVGGAWDVRARDRSQRATEVLVDVKIWGDKDDSDKALRELAWEAWRGLDRLARSTFDGWEVFNFRCSAPVRLSDPDGFPGYVVQVVTTVRTAPRSS
jgi:hypothetical protein